MQLWQIDIIGGVFLADGREWKLVTGIDDHSSFVVMVTAAAEPAARPVCAAFTAAMAVCGVPSEVLTDNGNSSRGGSPNRVRRRFCSSGSDGKTELPRA